MSPLRIEPAECGRTWTSLGALHRCTQTPGHDGAHQCFCGAVTGGAS